MQIRLAQVAALLCLSQNMGAATQAGHVEEFSLYSKNYERTRKLAVYTPPDYSSGRAKPYGLIVCLDGLTYYLTEIPTPAILDSLSSEGKIPPVIALFVDTSIARLEDLANNQKFAKFLGDEVVPWARAHWNITKDPRQTLIAGASAGGLGSAYVAFHRPDLFGNVLSQSGAFWRGNEGSNSAPYEWLTAQYASTPQKPVRFYIEVGAKEIRNAVGVGPVFIEANRRFRDALLKKGYSVAFVEVPGGDHEPGHWKRQFPEGLVSLTSDWDR